jgi:phosphoserine phosphatase RsbU/P
VCRVAEAEFEPTAAAPAEARRWVAERLRAWELDRWVDSAVLLTSELVTNVVLHASGQPRVTASVAEGILEIGVSDLDPHMPGQVRGPPAASQSVDEIPALSDSGRGLLLVDEVADEWGTTRADGGKHVWFRLDVALWSHRKACHCREPHPDRLKLISGRDALHSPGTMPPRD